MKWTTFLVIVFVSSAEGQVNQLWVDVNLQQEINNKWSWVGDAGARYTIDHSLSVAFGRGAIVYQASALLKLYGGVAYFHYVTPETKITGNEIRPWQGLRFDVNIGNALVLTNYSRLEERFIHSEGVNDFFLRFRNLTGLSFTVFQVKEQSKSVYLPVSFEFFEDLNKKLFINRFRVYMGAGYAFSKNRIELHYILQKGRLTAEESLELTENVYRLRWFRII